MLEALMPVIGAGISVASNIGAGKRNYKRQVALMDKQQQYNRENMQSQYDYQLQMMNEINKYNSPSAVAKRYREAGISPLSAFSSGGAQGLASASSPPSSSNPSPVGATPDSLSLMGSSALSGLEALARIESIKEQTRGQKIDNDNKQEGYDLKFDYQAALNSLTTEQALNERIKGRILKIDEDTHSIARDIAQGTKDVNINTAFANYENLLAKTRNIDQATEESKANVGVLMAKQITEIAQAEFIRHDIQRIDSTTRKTLIEAGFLADTYDQRIDMINMDYVGQSIDLSMKEFTQSVQELDWWRMNIKEYGSVVTDVSDAIVDWVDTLKDKPTMSDDEKRLQLGKLIIGALMAIKK